MVEETVFVGEGDWLVYFVAGESLGRVVGRTEGRLAGLGPRGAPELADPHTI